MCQSLNNSICPRAPPYWVWAFLIRKAKELSIIDSHPTNRPGTPSVCNQCQSKAYSLDTLHCSGFCMWALLAASVWGVLNSHCRFSPQSFWYSRCGMQPQILYFISSHTTMVSWLLIHPHLLAFGPWENTSLLSAAFSYLENRDEDSLSLTVSQGGWKSSEPCAATLRSFRGSLQCTQLLSSLGSTSRLIGCSFSLCFGSSPKAEHKMTQAIPLISNLGARLSTQNFWRK